MNSFQLLEMTTISVIVAFQLFIFYKTLLNINKFKSIFPNADIFYIEKVYLLPKFLKLHPKDILANLDNYKEESEPDPLVEDEYMDGELIRPAYYGTDERVEIEIISYNPSHDNIVTKKICHSLNTYLIRNRGIASDFHLIKDIVERNADAVEVEVNQTISLPLYLGLLGTFIGIVLGLFQISGVSFSGNDDALNLAIETLLNGVLIAMIASFMGLLLTIINTGYSFKGAKTIVEEHKNDFYTFIQIDLLPLLNQNINSTLYSLQNNLHKFNEDFKTNVSGLSSILGKNYDALVAQEKILTSLENIDISSFAKANVKVLQELKLTTENFSKFNKYLTYMNQIVNSTTNFTDKIDEMLERTDSFHNLGNHIIKTFEENKKLTEFLSSHYNSLDQSHQLINNSVMRVNSVLDSSLESLKEFTLDRITELQKITLKELDLMENQYPEKWKKLDNLDLLNELKLLLNEIKSNNASQRTQMNKVVDTINSNLLEATKNLSSIKNNTNNTLSKYFVDLFNRIFSKKKVKSKNEKK